MILQKQNIFPYREMFIRIIWDHTVLVSYQPRPIRGGPFCHTQILVEDQKDGASINEIGQLSDTR